MPASWRRFYLRQSLLLAASGLALALLFHFTRLDLWLADIWYDPQRQSWPARNAWWAAKLVHQWLRYVLIACALGCIARAWMRRHAADAAGWRVVALSALAVPLAVSVWKRLSSMHCPWDIDRFGGGAPYFDLLATAPAHVDLVGRCFPAGFVSTGGWLLAFALLRYPQDPRFSRRAGSAAVALCLCLGMVQQMRGAYFFSHVLWTLWLSWTVILAIHAATGAWRAPLAR